MFSAWALNLLTASITCLDNSFKTTTNIFGHQMLPMNHAMTCYHIRIFVFRESVESTVTAHYRGTDDEISCTDDEIGQRNCIGFKISFDILNTVSPGVLVFRDKAIASSSHKTPLCTKPT